MPAYPESLKERLRFNWKVEFNKLNYTCKESLALSPLHELFFFWELYMNFNPKEILQHDLKKIYSKKWRRWWRTMVGFKSIWMIPFQNGGEPYSSSHTTSSWPLAFVLYLHSNALCPWRSLLAKRGYMQTHRCRLVAMKAVTPLNNDRSLLDLHGPGSP